MGCDIHAGIEYRQNNNSQWRALLVPNRYFGKYADEPEMTARLPLDRDYDMFAILANVRNGSGFAGTKTGDSFDSISDNRGLPEDITPEASEQACTGDHSETWVNLKEILGFDWDRSTTHYGVVSAVEFERWDRMKQWVPAPAEYCGDIYGTNIKKITPDEMREKVRAALAPLGRADRREIEDALAPLSDYYTQISWEESYSASGMQIWTKILPHMLKLGNQHGYENVRLVMNFDS